MPTPTTIPIDSAALHTAYTEAQKAHPDQAKGWGKAIKAAYNELMDLWTYGRAVQFDGPVMLVQSATTPGLVYRSNGGCTCRASERAQAAGKACLCHHRAQRQLVCRMREIVHSADWGARLATARRERAYADAQELF